MNDIPNLRYHNHASVPLPRRDKVAYMGQATSQVMRLTSDDLGETWSPPQPVSLPDPGAFLRHPPLPAALAPSTLLLPLYYTPEVMNVPGPAASDPRHTATQSIRTWRGRGGWVVGANARARCCP